MTCGAIVLQCHPVTITYMQTHIPGGLLCNKSSISTVYLTIIASKDKIVVKKNPVS